MDTTVRLGTLADFPDGGGTYVEAAGRALAVFRRGERIWVTDDACPHAGAPLSAGNLDDSIDHPARTCVVCPLHAWAFTLDDGRCTDNPAIAVTTHAVRVADGVVWVTLGGV